MAAILVAALGLPGRAAAQQQVQGFAVERFQASAPGSSWLVLDSLALHGGLGAGMSLTFGYARLPLRVDVPGAGAALGVVQNQAFMQVALAIAYGCFRLTIAVPSPLLVTGESGTVGVYSYTSPHVTLAHFPDTVYDVPIALAALLAGRPDGPFRLAADAQLIIPSSTRAAYLTDDTFRGVLRVMVAGDHGVLRWAGHLGVHIRPLDEAPIPDTPRGSELLFAAAAGVRLMQGRPGALLLGPEVFGSSAFASFFHEDGTALEALLGATFARVVRRGMLLQVKLGAGAGLVPHLGAPEWRITTSIGISGRGP